MADKYLRASYLREALAGVPGDAPVMLWAEGDQLVPINSIEDAHLCGKGRVSVVPQQARLIQVDEPNWVGITVVLDFRPE